MGVPQHHFCSTGPASLQKSHTPGCLGKCPACRQPRIGWVTHCQPPGVPHSLPWPRRCLLAPSRRFGGLLAQGTAPAQRQGARWQPASSRNTRQVGCGRCHCRCVARLQKSCVSHLLMEKKNPKDGEEWEVVLPGRG